MLFLTQIQKMSNNKKTNMGKYSLARTVRQPYSESGPEFIMSADTALAWLKFYRVGGHIWVHYSDFGKVDEAF